MLPATKPAKSAASQPLVEVGSASPWCRRPDDGGGDVAAARVGHRGEVRAGRVRHRSRRDPVRAPAGGLGEVREREILHAHRVAGRSRLLHHVVHGRGVARRTRGTVPPFASAICCNAVRCSVIPATVTAFRSLLELLLFGSAAAEAAVAPRATAMIAITRSSRLDNVLLRLVVARRRAGCPTHGQPRPED